MYQPCILNVVNARNFVFLRQGDYGLAYCSHSIMSTPPQGNKEIDVLEESQKDMPSSSKEQERDQEMLPASMSSIVNNAEGDLGKLLSMMKNLKPALPKKSFSLAPYVNESRTLTSLVNLGADLSEIEKKPKVASYLANADFEKDCKPYLAFLLRNGIPESQIGPVCSKNPRIFMEDLDDLQARINYLRSKKFDGKSIENLVSKHPDVLSMKIRTIDNRLGILQKEFKLTGLSAGIQISPVSHSHPE